jgi:hypothetical protein
VARILNISCHMNPKCPHCHDLNSASSDLRTIARYGSYWRKSDGKKIQRFFCFSCKRSFSFATNHSCFQQKKRHKNKLIAKLLSGDVSLREAARISGLNRKTIARKLIFLAEQARVKTEKDLIKRPKAFKVQFDDLETFEHTKCKPLSVTLMVEEETRYILGFEVSQMAAKGRLSKIALKKYGYRKDKRSKARKKLFKRMKPYISENASFRSDSNPYYPKDLKRYFPGATHETVIGARGAITGQGELKKIKWDPLFSLNHTCAMLRAHVSRLIRKTWNTTKDPERLRDHLAVYQWTHNQRLQV